MCERILDNVAVNIQEYLGKGIATGSFVQTTDDFSLDTECGQIGLEEDGDSLLAE